MYMLLTLIFVPSILAVIAFVHQLAFKKDSWEHGYATGSILAIFLMFAFHSLHPTTKSAKKLFSTYKTIFTTTGLILAFIGGFLWMMGEYFEWTGRFKHPILDPIGAMFCFAAACLSLLVHFSR